MRKMVLNRRLPQRGHEKDGLSGFDTVVAPADR